jgi:hypothetical protein
MVARLDAMRTMRPAIVKMLTIAIDHYYDLYSKTPYQNPYEKGGS